MERLAPTHAGKEADKRSTQYLTPHTPLAIVTPRTTKHGATAMTYEQLVASRPARIAAAQALRAECCAGCRQSFASYGMTKAQAYVEDGHAFCNSDCALTAEVANDEAESFARLADEF